MKSKYKLFCFDMDGTLLDSMPFWCSSKLDLLRDLGYEIREEEIPYLLSTSVEQTLKEWNTGLGWEDIVEQYRQIMHGHYLAGIAPKPGAAEYLKHLHENGVRVCVGTATAQNMARDALEKAGLLPYVEFVTDIREMGYGKEHKEFFESIAHRAGVQPEEILMHEDALYAMQGAKKAGCGVVAIEDETALGEREEIRAIADRYILSYHELME